MEESKELQEYKNNEILKNLLMSSNDEDVTLGLTILINNLENLNLIEQELIKIFSSLRTLDEQYNFYMRFLYSKRSLTGILPPTNLSIFQLDSKTKEKIIRMKKPL